MLPYQNERQKRSQSEGHRSSLGTDIAETINKKDILQGAGREKEPPKNKTTRYIVADLKKKKNSSRSRRGMTKGGKERES